MVILLELKGLLQTALPMVALLISLTALIITTRNFKRKSGVYVRGTYCIVMGGPVPYVGNIVLENLKDRTVIIFEIYLKVGQNYYIKLEDFTGNPKILKPFEVFSNSYDPPDFYSCSVDRINLNKLMGYDGKRNLVLATSQGKYEVGEFINKWEPIQEHLSSNSLTVEVLPQAFEFRSVRCTLNVIFLVEIIFKDKEVEKVTIRSTDKVVNILGGFPLSKQELESKDKLQSYLVNKLAEKNVKYSKLVVHDIAKIRAQYYGDFYNYEFDAYHYNWIEYRVWGPIQTKFNDFLLFLENRQYRSSSKIGWRVFVLLLIFLINLSLYKCVANLT